MVDIKKAQDDLKALGLAVDRSGTRLTGALHRNGPLYQGPPFSIDIEDGKWRVILGVHSARWGRISYFKEFDDAVEFVTKVYSELPDSLADGWTPNLSA